MLRRQAEDRIGPEHAAAARSSATSPPSRRSPAPATCAASRRPRRRAQRRARSSPATAGATPPSGGRRERVPEQVRPLPHRRRPGRALRPHPARRPPAGGARPRVQAAARLPAARQCAAGHGDQGGRCADHPARACRPPSWTSPRIKLERLPWLRRTGKLDEAKALAAPPPTNQTDAWWNERQQLARDLLAAGHPADAYAVAVQHGQTRASPSPRPSSSPAGSRCAISRSRPTALKHFQTLYDGVSTDISKSRAAYWLGRAHEAAGRSKEASDWYGRAAAFGQTFYGQLAARRLPGGATQAAERSRRLRRRPPGAGRPRAGDGGALYRPGRRLRAHAALPAAAGAHGETARARPLLLAQLAIELKRPDIALTDRAARAPRTASPCSTPRSRWSISARPARSSARWHSP